MIDLSEKLTPLVREEMQALLALKEQECARRNEKFDERINMWDFRYFLNMREHKEYQVDHEAIKRYFPIDVVTKGMFGIYEDLLCLRFEEVPHPHVWHEDVQMFEVRDGGSDAVIGYFYLGMRLCWWPPLVLPLTAPRRLPPRRSPSSPGQIRTHSRI